MTRWAKMAIDVNEYNEQEAIKQRHEQKRFERKIVICSYIALAITTIGMMRHGIQI